MRTELQRMLREAAASKGWTSNTQSPWEPIIALLEEELHIPPGEIHAAKIQKRSARKTLWQGRLHRAPLQALFLAVDEPCDEKAFEVLSKSIEERFNPPSVWADACLVASGNKLIGYIEREGVGFASWLQSEATKVRVALCDRVPDQIELRSRLKAAIRTPTAFVSLLERNVKNDDAKKFLADAFGLSPDLILASSTNASANAAKGIWEGRDVDPSVRYRLGMISASEWTWNNAAIEIVQRMDPADLSLGLVLLFAKPNDRGAWSRARAFVCSEVERRDDLVRVLKQKGIDDIRVVSSRATGNQETERSGNASAALRVRDSDAGDVRYEVSRPRRRVHDLLTNWLREWGLEQGLEIQEGADSISMYDALVIRPDHSDLLIEVKSSLAPGIVRLAVGQLIDYRRVLSRGGHVTEGILLFPQTEKLTDELKDLLRVVGFGWAVLKQRNERSDGFVLELHHHDGRVETIP